MFAVGVDAYIVAAVLPAISDDLHEPIARVGLLASSYALPMALLAPVFGPLSDRRGRRYALRLGSQSSRRPQRRVSSHQTWDCCS
jgi:predicted MFS family arabinose efflux permease